MPEVIVVGDIGADQFYIVPHLPAWDEGVLVDEWYERPGGKGGNTAAALSRLGTSAGIIAAAGDDHSGKVAIEGLKSNGVDTRGITIVPGGQTYYCIMMLDATGEKAILVVHTDLTYPSPEMMRQQSAYLASARHAHFIGIDPDRMSGAIRQAKELGLSVSVDLDAAYQGLDACRSVIEPADVVLVNRQGAEQLFPGADRRQAAANLLQIGPSVAVVTAGSLGVVGCDGTQTVELPAFNIKVKDTTGAGDVFAGAFVHGYLQGRPLAFSLRFASAAAALATAAIGGQGALPTESEVMDFLKQHPAA